MDVYVVIGAANARKSSLIRGLTGIGKSPRAGWKVRHMSGKTIELWCRTAALQEGGAKMALSPSAFANKMRMLKPSAVLIALRVDGPTYACEDYLRPLPKGWRIAGAAFLGADGVLARSRFSWRGPAIHSCPTAPNDPANLTSAAVRKVWGWV